MLLVRSFSALRFRAGNPPLLRRVHSLAGTLPLGVFLVLHLGQQAAALAGREAYERQLTGSPSLAGLLLELLLVYLPLLFHAGYGLALTFRRRDVDAVTGTPIGAVSLRRRVLQPATGILLGGFLLLHLWQFRWRPWSGDIEPADFFPELCASLSSTAAGGVPLMAIAYLSGVAAAAFHFSNGLYGFCETWGITLSDRASRVASGICALTGLGLFTVGAITVIYLATGSVSLPRVGY
jgi:succinate dehydrogenase/fumarate reductase cytochrome b subunit (b558 family)